MLEVGQKIRIDNYSKIGYGAIAEIYDDSVIVEFQDGSRKRYSRTPQLSITFEDGTKSNLGIPANESSTLADLLSSYRFADAQRIAERDGRRNDQKYRDLKKRWIAKFITEKMYEILNESGIAKGEKQIKVIMDTLSFGDQQKYSNKIAEFARSKFKEMGIGACLEKYDFRQADKLAEKEGVLVTTTYSEVKKQYETLKIGECRSMLLSILSKYKFDAAEQYYQINQRYIDRTWYDLKVNVVKDEKEHELNACECRSVIVSLLSKNEFDAAERYYQSNRRYIDKTWHDLEIRKYKAREEKIIRRCQSQLVDLLSKYEFDAAEKYYQTNQRYLDRTWYDSETKKYKAKEEKRDREYQSQLVDMLSKYGFDAAEKYYQTNQRYLDRTWYDSEVRKYRNRFDISNLLEEFQFKSADKLYNESSDVYSVNEYQDIKADAIQKYFLSKYKLSLDDDQAKALAIHADNLLVAARAGSGKTRMLTAKAAFLIDLYRVDPDKILIMTFNKKASIEVKKRIANDYNIDNHENARTFHSLAYQIERPTQRILYSSNSDEDFTDPLHEYIRDILRQVWREAPKFKKEIVSVFKKETAELERHGTLLDDEHYLAYRRNLVQLTLNGESVKSAGEKYIADFLFEHDIPYDYERVFSWKKNPYRPDFRIHTQEQDYVLEHWALDPDDRTCSLPNDWTISADEYRDQIQKKRYYWDKRDEKLLETNSRQLANGRDSFEQILKRILESNRIECHKLPEEEIQKKVARIQHERMVRLFIQFIQKCKKRRWKAADAVMKIREHETQNEREKVFLGLAVEIYSRYEQSLDKDGKIDFDILMERAIEKIEKTEGCCNIQLGLRKDRSIKMNDLEYILIDEYQDLSRQFFDLLVTIRKFNPNVKLFCVGDDWQAINAFAGSDLKYFEEFQKDYQYAQRTNLLTNYRSSFKIVEVGNKIMKHDKKPAEPHSSAKAGTTGKRDIETVFIEWDKKMGQEFQDDLKFRFFVEDKLADGTTREREKDNGSIQARYLKAIYEILSREENRGKSCKIISRTNHFYFLKNLVPLKEKLIKCLADSQEQKRKFEINIACGTAHNFKGLESDIVFILKACNRSFPLLHPDTELFGFFGETWETELDSERRLFYVAMTRAKEQVYCLYEGEEESDFIKNLPGLYYM